MNLKVKKLSRSLVSYRWGYRKRSPSSIVRVSSDTRILLNSVPDLVRRDFVDTSIRVGFRSRWFSQLKKRFGL